MHEWMSNSRDDFKPIYDAHSEYCSLLLRQTCHRICFHIHIHKHSHANLRLSICVSGCICARACVCEWILCLYFSAYYKRIKISNTIWSYLYQNIHVVLQKEGKIQLYLPLVVDATNFGNNLNTYWMWHAYIPLLTYLENVGFHLSIVDSNRQPT